MSVSGEGPAGDVELLKAKLAARAKSLELLYDYTKFHIGVYLTLSASYITVATVKIPALKGSAEHLLAVNPCWMALAVVCFLLAGLAAGIIVSSITQYAEGGSAEFLETEIGPWDAKRIHLRARYWTYIEHTSFWVGLLAAIGSIIFHC
jgi:hypothetical protein